MLGYRAEGHRNISDRQLIPVVRLTSRWKRPGMWRDLHAMERVFGAEISGQWGSPGASARGC
jgi:hypothetical protein